MSDLIYPALPGLKPVVRRRPEWRSDIIEAWSGEETVIGRRQFPRWVYTLSYEVLRSTAALPERAQLMDFFNRHRGSGESFLFVDEEDNAVVDQAIGTTDGVTTTYQLTRTLYDWVEPVWVVTGTPVIKRAGVTLTVGTQYTIGSMGQLVLAAAGSAGQALTWTGSYAMRVRFAKDDLEFERFLQGLWQVGTVGLISKVYSA
ncbi:MAG: DUF2460 domain-containing protein [Gallionellaceae bacterium]|jgi:uncharacterized protein (TIGR02217 family)